MDTTQTTPSSAPTQNIPTRLNNPGDLRNIGQVGATSDSSGFASFPDPKTGYAALLNDVQSKINRSPSSTLADFANTYAPPSDGNNSAQYAANLANKLGVPPNAPLSSLQPKIGQFAEAIGSNEGYKDINSNPNPTPQEVKASDPNAPRSTFTNLLLGAGSLGLGATALAFGQPELLPEAAELGGEAVAGSGISGVLGSLANGVKSAVGNIIKGIVPAGIADEAVNGIFGTKDAGATKTAGDEQANATAQAGTEEANATRDASANQIEEEESLADEARTQQQVKDAEAAASALNQSLQTTPTGKILASLPTTPATLAHMAQNGYLPDTSSGLNNFTEASRKADTSIGEMSEGVEKVLKEEGGNGHLHDALEAAYKNIDQYVPTHDRESAKRYVDEIAQTYNKAYGKGTGTIGLDRMEQGKREQYKAVSKWDAQRPSAKTAAHRSFAKGLRSTIEKNTKHKDLYNRVMKEEQKIFDAKKIMKKMNGKKALEHKGLFRGVLKEYGQYVGTYIGDKLGGPLGAVVGTMVADHLKNATDKRFGKTYFESPEGKKLIELASKLSPAVAKVLKKELHKYGVKAEALEKELQKPERQLAEPSSNSTGKPIIATGESEIKPQAQKVTKHDTSPKEVPLKKKRPELYEPYTEPGVIDFGKTGTSKHKKTQKGLLTIR